MKAIEFPSAFEMLTGNAPFPWQEALYKRLVADDIPSSCALPTGLGKTSVIAIWLIALANHHQKIPRRLVYVVNRRTVVDQSTDEATKYRDKLAGELEAALWTLCSATRKKDDRPLAISTLRGQFADNREWSADPARPAIIVGTVDMIGSRLLFSGYGIGFKSKPLHAGFLGQDVLLVHDEAHLEPAFQDLLVAIQGEQDRCAEFRRFHVMELSATSRGKDAFKLTDEDRLNSEVRKRILAKKSVHLYKNEDEKKLPDELAELALSHNESRSAVLVFARTVEAVEKVAEKLRKAKHQVEMLTGTLRGKERDELVETHVFRRFLPGADALEKEQTVYLVCTSAGEVGVNISADHLVCDLSTYESMAQRFGRVNRFGVCDDTRIEIVYPSSFDNADEEKTLENDELNLRRLKTLMLLRRLNGDGSPEALDNLHPEDRLAAFGPKPIILSTSDILFDVWALTTVRDKLPGRPPVEPYLHGESERELPETHVAWREEVDKKYKFLDQCNAEELLEDYPIKPHELLRDRSDRVFKHLISIAERHPDQHAWLLDDDGTVEWLREIDGTVRPFTLKDLADKDKKDRINYQTILLPPAVGGLQNGLLDGKSDFANDVADEWNDEKGAPRRKRQDNEEAPQGMRLIRVLDKNPDSDEATEDDGSDKRFWYWFVRPRSADDDGSMTSRFPVLLDVHTSDVKDATESIVDRLPLPPDLKRALIIAARFHDLGKDRVVWQRGIGNPNPSTILLAKSGGKMKPVELSKYRHEFGSLLDVQDEPEFHNLSDDLKELVLHLIAAHHGRGRPHFPPEEVFDHEPKGKDVSVIASEVPQRFARLQRKYGRWGLAYLESLLRAADYAASASPSKTVEDEP